MIGALKFLTKETSFDFISKKVRVTAYVFSAIFLLMAIIFTLRQELFGKYSEFDYREIRLRGNRNRSAGYGRHLQKRASNHLHQRGH